MLQVRKDVRNKLDNKLIADRERGLAVNQTMYTTKYRGVLYTHMITESKKLCIYRTCVGCNIIRMTIISKEKGGD